MTEKFINCLHVKNSLSLVFLVSLLLISNVSMAEGAVALINTGLPFVINNPYV